MKFFLLSLFMLFTIACNRSDNEDFKQVSRGVYFWQSEPDMEQADLKKFNNLDVEKYYIKVFEVEPHPAHRAVPVSEVQFHRFSRKLDSVAAIGELVPVIYIRNKTFTSLDSHDMGWLARKVFQRAEALLNYKEFKEMQIDCDWTASSRDLYFHFIKKLKKRSEKKVSVTLRLHQIRDQKLMGIPPADRGVLMYYNMGNLTSFDETNSLLNNEVGRNYLKPDKKYDLPLDFAMPAFSWGVLFRYREFKGILNDFRPAYLPDSILEPQSKNHWFQIQQDTLLKNKYFRYHDEIRFEKASAKALLEGVQLLKSIQTPNSKTNIIFYNWHEAKQYDPQILDSVYRAFK